MFGVVVVVDFVVVVRSRRDERLAERRFSPIKGLTTAPWAIATVLPSKTRIDR
jgi:hypothetical protein